MASDPDRFEPEMARLELNLADFYSEESRNAEAETMYLCSLDKFERLAKKDPAQFEADLATAASNFGV